MKINNEKGQSTIEYILLLAVVLLLTLSVVRSQFFTKLLGPESEVFERMRLSLQYSYRHALPGFGEIPAAANARYGSGEHDSYGVGGRSRFFRGKIYP